MKRLKTGEGLPPRPRPALTSSASFPSGMPMARRPVWSSAISTLPSSLRSSFLKRLAYRESPSLLPSQAAAGNAKPRRSWNMAGPCGTGSGTLAPRFLRAGCGREASPALLPTPAAARGGAGPARPRLSGEGEERLRALPALPPPPRR